MPKREKKNVNKPDKSPAGGKARSRGGPSTPRKSGRGADQGGVSDDNCDVDTASQMSVCSDGSYLFDETQAPDAQSDDVDMQNDLEDKLVEYIDGTTQKSLQRRTECLKSLKKMLSSHVLGDLLMDRKVTMTDCIERCLKKGKGEEQALAADLTALLSIQLGHNESEEVFKSISPLLQTLTIDPSAGANVRAACTTALGRCSFISASDIHLLENCMDSFETVFRAAYMRQDGSMGKFDPQVNNLHCAALTSWTLLASISPPSKIEALMNSHLLKLPGMLHSDDVNMRIAAGEALALLYEMIRQFDKDFEGPDMMELCDTLKKLATDGNKQRAKKDRRQQRSSFRDILGSIEDFEPPYEVIKFGQEKVELDNWVWKITYVCLKEMLGPGMNSHLMNNELLRDIFQLGPAISPADISSKVSKNEKQFYNAAAFKARTKSRGKLRDKRSTHLDFD